MVEIPDKEYHKLQKRVRELEAEVAEHRQKEKEKEKEKEKIRRLATVVRDSNDAITIQDLEGNITAWNRGAELMFGYSEQEALRMKIWELAPPNKSEEQRDFNRRIFADENVASFETQRRTKDGRLLDVWLTVTKLVDDAGKVIGVAATERDITERKRVEGSLCERVKELKCIADLARLAEKGGGSIEGLVRESVNMLPSAWKHSGSCCARIIMDSREFKTANFKETQWCQSADINVDNKKFGVVMVCYLEEKPQADDGPFLKEETELIETIADFLGHIIQHRLSEGEIKKRLAELEIFHKSTVGRELKMMDLEKEVNSLLKELGRQPKYKEQG